MAVRELKMFADSLHLSGKTYANVLEILHEYRNKSKVHGLAICKSAIGRLNTFTFNGFQNILKLELIRCSICEFDEDVFDKLVHLNYINLSQNNIVTVDNGLFKFNRQLVTLILQGNMLYDIDFDAFANLSELQTLDLSYNITLLLDKHFLKCANLNELYLNNCRIEYIVSNSFRHLRNLTHLALNNNKIENLEKYTFRGLNNLKSLNLSNNLIQNINNSCFWELTNLRTLHLATNYLQIGVDKFLFLNKINLVHLDLTNNEVSMIRTGIFDYCENLKCLKLTVSSLFESYSITKLSNLTQFELVCKQEPFTMPKQFWSPFQYKYCLKILKLTFLKLKSIKLCNFALIKNLEHLHIECLEPSNEHRICNFQKIFPEMLTLKTVVLKKLNSFIISGCINKKNCIRHLSLSGLKNKKLTFLFWNYEFLEYLDLSFGEFETISKDALLHLKNLKHLELEYSKLKRITSQSFKHNYKLEILNCSNCHIETIQDDTFINLKNLLKLDLRNNCFRVFSVDKLRGLNKDKCIILL